MVSSKFESIDNSVFQVGSFDVGIGDGAIPTCLFPSKKCFSIHHVHIPLNMEDECSYCCHT